MAKRRTATTQKKTPARAAFCPYAVGLELPAALRNPRSLTPAQEEAAAALLAERLEQLRANRQTFLDQHGGDKFAIENPFMSY